MDISRRILAVTGAFFFAAAVSGCAVGPNFHPVAAPVVSGYAPEPLPPHTASADAVGGASQTLRPGADIPGQWWTLFHSPQLNRLIEQALKANPNLQAAQASLRVAQENAAAQEGYLYPSVVAGATPWFDNFCVLLRRDGHSQLVYKHAISTIMPGHPIQLFEGAEEAPAGEKV